MKSIKYILAITCAIVFAACDYLDVVPDNVTVLDHAFSSRYTAEQYLTTCYWHLPKGECDNNPAMLGSAEAIFNNDLNYEHNNRNSYGTFIARGTNSATNPYIDYWSGTNGGRNLYNGIRDCNVFLENIDKVQDLPEPEKRRWTAEVKLLKAYFHFYLLRYYGPIHIIRENLPVYQNVNEVKQQREPVDDCFDYVLELLDEVINSNALPKVIQNTSTELGRFTQPAALTMKARVMMYYASPLFNGNTAYEAFVNADGEPFFNQKEDPNRWTMAVEACKKAIESCEQNGIRLYRKSDYLTSFKLSDSTMLNCALRNAFSDRWNPEVIWGNPNVIYNEIQRSGQAGLQSVIRGVVYSYYAPTINTVENFYSDKGVPIDEDNTYDYTNRYKLRTGGEDEKFYIEKGQQTAALNFDREPRFYAFLGFDRGKWYGRGKLEDDATTWHVESKLKEYGAAFDVGMYSATGYTAKKIVNLKSGYESNQLYSIEAFAFPEMRYSDLLLYYAEALNEMKAAPDQQVYDAIDEVRARAGLEGVKQSWQLYSKKPSKPNDKSGMREIIHRERLIELAFENAHYWDLRRWKEAIATLNGPVKAWNVLSDNNADYYTVRTYFTQSFTQRDYLAPIPESEIIINPQLKQNPGW
jgi:hypothetical protein